MSRKSAIRIAEYSEHMLRCLVVAQAFRHAQASAAPSKWPSVHDSQPMPLLKALDVCVCVVHLLYGIPGYFYGLHKRQPPSSCTTNSHVVREKTRSDLNPRSFRPLSVV